jgi:hypothetical protein
MFIAYGPRQGSSPQRGDMFIAVAPGEQFFTADVDEFNVCLNPSLSPCRPETCHPAGVKHHLIGPQAINMSLLQSEDAPHNSRILRIPRILRRPELC